MHFFLDLYIDLVYSILMIKENIPTKKEIREAIQTINEMFEEYNKLNTIDEKIEYVKSIRDMDMFNTLKLEYNNIITKLYSHKQSQQ